VFDMKRTRTHVLAPACALAVLLAACGGKEAPKPAAGSTPAATDAAPAAAAPARGPVEAHLDAFRLGYALGPDGQVRGEGDTFARGEKVFISFGIRDAKAGSSTRVAWVKNPVGAKLSEETKALPPEPGTVSFVADSAGWAVGEYAVEIWVLEPPAEPRRLAATKFVMAATRSK
jgi:hypothetical protein